MLQKLADVRIEPNKDQVARTKSAIESQAAKKRFIAEMLQPVALAMTSIVLWRLQYREVAEMS